MAGPSAPPDRPRSEPAVAPFGDGLCIKGTSGIENLRGRGLSTMAAAEQHRYEPGHSITRFCCGESMKLVKAIPRIGSYPELQTYRCERCHNVETIEVT
jgi:hypothetical protein